MLTAIADYVKSRRHELGKHVLFVGSAVRTSPGEVRVDDLLGKMALEWATEQGKELPEEEAELAALEMMARAVGDHVQRCKILGEVLEKGRSSEAHTRLARMISDGYFSAVFTTDPTGLLQESLHNRHMDAEKDYHLLVAGVDPADEIEVALAESQRVVVVKCAGEVSRDFLPLSAAEVRAAITSISETIASAFRPLALFVGYAARDLPFIEHVSREGERVFWVNRIIPMDDEELYQELKLESPASVAYHSLQPEVMEMLGARSSQRHLLCREAGEPSAFFSALEERVARHEYSTRRARKVARDQTLLSGGPYRFLDFYDVEDAEVFFGREHQVADVIEMISEHPLSVLFGASGRGKTSLLCAGVVAAMQEEAREDEGRRWLPVYVRCGEDPLENIKDAVSKALKDLGRAAPHRDGELADLLGEAIESSGHLLVLIVDQFEEYFVKLGDRTQAEVARQLAEALATETDKLRVLLSIREDYLGQLYSLDEYLPEIMHNAYRLNKLSPEQAERATIKPAASFGIHVEKDLVDQILLDLSRDDGVEPAQLQIVMDRLYQSLSGRRHRIGLHAYEQLDGAEHILRDYLDYALSQFPALERRTARAILKDMVASSELKMARSLERIAAEVAQAEDAVEKVLARLIDLRLVRRVGREHHRAYELVHEYVADKIEHWMSEREIEVKDVQDLLTRELDNYQRFGLQMSEGALRIIATYRNELNISPEEMELIIRSAAHRDQDVGYWLDRAEELGERLEATFKAMLQDEHAHVHLVALRGLTRHLSPAYLPELVRLLDDDDSEVRETTEQHLRRLDRELVQMLGHGDEQERRLAAYALGRIDSRRGLRPLAEALEDGDEQMREEVAEALMEMDAPGTTRLLLRRLSNGEDAPWAVAYALGRVSQEPESLEEIKRARSHQPDSPQTAFALALAHEHRREHDRALELLDEAEGLATTETGMQAIAEARAGIKAQRERATEGGEDWPTFHGNARRTGFAPQELLPPLAVKWRFQTRGPVVASASSAAGLICVGSRDGYLYALDSSSGSLRWELRTGDRVEAAPALDRDIAYVTSRDGQLYAAGLQDGDVRWIYDTGAPSRSSPAVHSGLVIAGNQEGQVVAVAARDGKLRWQAQADDDISAAASIMDGRLFIGSWDGKLYALDPETGEQIWRTDTEGPIATSASGADGRLYCGSDAEAIFAFAADTGEILWRRPVGGRVRSCPALGGDRAIVGCMDGNVYALNRADGAIVWTAETEDEVLSAPAVAAGVVYIGSKDGTLYALSLEDGQVLWSYPTSYAVYSSPLIAEEMVVLGMEYYNVVAFAPEENKARGGS